MERFDRKCDALSTTDAKGDQAARQTVAAHRVDQLGRQHCAGGTYWMAVRNSATFDVDDLLRQPELPGDDDGDGGEGFIDLGTFDGANVPAGALQSLLDRRHGSQSEHARFDCGDAVSDQARGRGETAFVGPRAVGEHHGRSSIVQSGSITGSDGAVWTESWLEPRQHVDRGAGPVVLVLLELRGSLPRHLHRHNLRFEMAGGLRGCEPLLRLQCPAVLRLTANLVFLDQVLGMPAGMRVRESVVEPVAQHAVVQRVVAHTVAPA